MEVLRSPGQAGYPPSVATDALLGFSVMAYQSAEALIGRCEVPGGILVRLVGTCARAHQGSQKDDIAQRAKVGYCPWCARPTHGAAPPRYVVGELFRHKAHGAQLWEDHGPRAARYFAATLNARGNGSISSAWDWAAQYLILKAPALSDGYFGAEHLGAPILPAQSARETLGTPSTRWARFPGVGSTTSPGS